MHEAGAGGDARFQELYLHHEAIAAKREMRKEDIEWEQDNQARLELVSDPRWIAESDTPFEERLYNAHHQSSKVSGCWLGST